MYLTVHFQVGQAGRERGPGAADVTAQRVLVDGGRAEKAQDARAQSAARGCSHALRGGRTRHGRRTALALW